MSARRWVSRALIVGCVVGWATMREAGAQQLPFPQSDYEARIDWRYPNYQPAGLQVGITEEDCQRIWYTVPLGWTGSWTAGYTILTGWLDYTADTDSLPGCGFGGLSRWWYDTPDPAPGEVVWIAIAHETIPDNLSLRAKE